MICPPGYHSSFLNITFNSMWGKLYFLKVLLIYYGGQFESPQSLNVNIQNSIVWFPMEIYLHLDKEICRNIQLHLSL